MESFLLNVIMDHLFLLFFFLYNISYIFNNDLLGYLFNIYEDLSCWFNYFGLYHRFSFMFLINRVFLRSNFLLNAFKGYLIILSAILLIFHRFIVILNLVIKAIFFKDLFLLLSLNVLLYMLGVKLF